MDELQDLLKRRADYLRTKYKKKPSISTYYRIKEVEALMVYLRRERLQDLERLHDQVTSKTAA